MQEDFLKNLKTVKNIINATPQTLSLITNIPPKNACKIMNLFNYLRQILTLIMLIICSYEDLKTREISDKIWIIFSPIRILITFIEFFLKNY